MDLDERRTYREGVTDPDYDQEAINEDILRRATARGPQQATRPSAETEALGQMLMEAINREVAIRTRLIEAQRLLATEIRE